MSHNLDTTTGAASFAFSAIDGPGWHGLGEPLTDDKCDVFQACVDARIAWSPVEERLYTMTGEPMDLKVVRRNDTMQNLCASRYGQKALSLHYPTVPHTMQLRAAARPMLAAGAAGPALAPSVVDPQSSRRSRLIRARSAERSTVSALAWSRATTCLSRSPTPWG